MLISTRTIRKALNRKDYYIYGINRISAASGDRKSLLAGRSVVRESEAGSVSTGAE